MPYQSDPDGELSPEAVDILKIILEDTKTLRSVDLGDAPPSTIAEAE